MAFKAATRIKAGDDKSSVEYYERGEDVSKSDFESDEWDELVAAKAVMDSKEFDVTFPEHTDPVNQASGTPSNLEQVEGTTLQAAQPKPGDPDYKPDEAAAANPADPPKVKDEGTAKGFETEGSKANAKE
jgi:hypothetical protein